MLWLLRHVLAIAVLPFTMAVLIPLWTSRRNGATLAIGTGPGELLAQGLGASLIGGGLLLFGSSVRQFANEGRGTLAPWAWSCWGPTAMCATRRFRESY
jgi:hypothetical protein